jgi:hypothetical protein
MIKDCSITIWANQFSWPMRNNHLLPYPSTGALAGHCELVDFYEPKEVFCNCSSKKYCNGQFTATVGHAQNQNSGNALR